MCYSPSRFCLLVIPRTVACQNPLSMELFGREYWNELPFHSPGRQSIVMAPNKDLRHLRILLRKR